MNCAGCGPGYRRRPGGPRLSKAGILLSVILAAGLGGCSDDQRPLDPISEASSAIAASTPTSQSPAAFPSNDTFISVAKAARASVVNISSSQKAKPGEKSLGPFFDDPFFRRFFGEEFERRFPAPRERKEQGLGSGVIVS